MQRDVIGLVALDLVLGIFLGAAMHVALVFGVVCMHLDDLASDVTGFRIPAYVIADLECVVIAGAVAHLASSGLSRNAIEFTGINRHAVIGVSRWHALCPVDLQNLRAYP